MSVLLSDKKQMRTADLVYELSNILYRTVFLVAAHDLSEEWRDAKQLLDELEYRAFSRELEDPALPSQTKAP